MSTFSNRCKNLFQYNNSPLRWVDEQTLPEFTDTQSFANWLAESSESIEYIDKPLSSALDHVEWAFGEVDVSTQELLEQRCTEVQNECMYHLTSILSILKLEHDFEISVPFELPPDDSAPWPIDKFAQPDVMMIPLSQTISNNAGMNGIEITEQEKWTMGCCICATCLIMIYHKMELRKQNVLAGTS